MALFLAKKFSIFKKYANFSDVFSKKSAVVLLNYLNINKHIINLKSDKQPSFWLIYSLGIMKLKTLKTYIKSNLFNSLIESFTFSAKTYIFFVQKFDESFCLYIDYQNRNNLTMKNQYLLLLIKKLLDWLVKAKRFIQFNLPSGYYCMRIKESNKWKTTFKTWYSHYKY